MNTFNVNGWNVFHKQNHSEIVDVRITVIAGSEKEDRKEIYGVSHFIEHLLFKGTQKRGYLDISDEIAAIGGQSNAFTSRAMVSYYIRIIKMHWGEAFEILSDMFFNSVFDEKEIEKERNVIIEEAKNSIDDHESFIMDEGIQDTLQPDRGHRIIGTLESIASITREDILDFKSKHYHPGNILISISGNVKKDEAIQTLSAHLPKVTPEKKEIYNSKEEHFNDTPLLVNRENLQQAYSISFFKGLGKKDPLYDAQKILLNAIGGGMHSLLFKKLREEHGLCYHIDAGEVGASNSSSLVCVSSSLSKENVQKTKDLVLEILDTVKSEGIDEKLLNISKVDFTSYIAMSTETSTGYVMYYGINYLMDNYRNFDTAYSSFHSISNDQVIEVANKIFSPPKDVLLS